MTKKKPRQTGPTSFFEWVVGTTVDSATRQGNSKPSRRDTLRIELSTDDEDDTDSLRVTYPRNGRKPTPGVAKVRSKDGMKKVRFEDAPRKSAMKKTKSTKVVTEFETDEEDSEDREKVKKIKKKTKKIVDDSEDEDEPHPTCKCSDCIRQRQKAKKGSQGQQCLKKKTSSDSEDSDSEICVKKNQQEKKKGKKAQSDSEAESTEDIDSESENQKATKKGKKQKDGKKDQAKSSDEPSTEKGKSNKKDKQQQKGDEESKADHKATKKRQQQEGNKKGDYPEGMPGPHPRRPNYIEPVRAEVVQTERVLEGPEDPKPNAYFDAEHNIVRVYHGPVYGGNHSQGLYPKRNPNNRPLPMGAVHPTQNPWFNGFKDGKAQGPEATNVPITQGMPMNAMYPPARYGYGYPPPYPGYPPGPPPNEGGWNRGAFAQMSGANGPGDKDNSVPNNVGPGSVKPSSRQGNNNPYYVDAKPKRSGFSDWGSQGSKKIDNNGNAASGWSNNGDNGKPWGQTSNDSWGKGSNGGGSWGGNKDQNDGADDWGKNNSPLPADRWDTTHQTSNTDTWGPNNQSDDWSAPQSTPNKPAENNVAPIETMPGSYPGPTPAWGDPTAAAATGGAVDNEVDDGMHISGW